MSHSGKEKGDRRGEEYTPLTAYADGAEQMETGGPLETTMDGVVEGATSAMMLRSVNTEPVISRDTAEDLDQNYTQLSFLHNLHDEVDKIFDNNWSFDHSCQLTTDPNATPLNLNPMGRESSKLALSEFYHVDEAEYSRHRRVSYPHIHQPLRSLSSRSLSKSVTDDRLKKKRKKKKRKEKMRSFPSRSAIQSPPIPEEEERDEEQRDEELYTSSSSSDEDLDLEHEGEGEDDYVDTAEIQLEEVMVPTDGHRSLPDMRVTPATPSPERMLRREDEEVGGEEGGGGGEEEMRSETPDQRPQRPTTLGMSLGVGEGPVGFYIGSEHPSPQPDRKKSFTSGTSMSDQASDSSQPLLPLLSGEETSESRRDSVQSLGSTIPPSQSEVSETEGPPFARRKLSTGGKVSFFVGGDSSYTNLHAHMSEASTQGDQSEQQHLLTPTTDENKENEESVKGKKRGGSGRRRRGSSEGEINKTDSKHKLLRVPSEEGTNSNRSFRRHHHHHEHFKHEYLIMRRQKGSEVKLNEKYAKSPTETEEAAILNRADLDDMTSHRFEDQRGIRRHKIARSKGALHSIVHIGKSHHEKKPKPTKKIDHSPHEMFVELDELHFGGDDMWEWREKARWIKFEEDVEEGAERWGKPHVASLSFHSLLELRRGLEKGSLLLDLEAKDLNGIIHNVVENLVIQDLVPEDVKGKLLQTLLLKHKHVTGRSAFLRRSSSYSNLTSLDSSGKRHQQNEKGGLLHNLSQTSLGSTLGLNKNPSQVSFKKGSSSGKGAAKLEMVKVDVDNNMSANAAHGDNLLSPAANLKPSYSANHLDMTAKHSDGIHIGLTPVEQKKHVQDIMRRIPKGSEASTVLVGQVNFLTKPAMAFVRLAEGQILDNLTEVPLPVRFLFILLGPEQGGMDYHEVGRSLSTLMSNQQFHDVAYRAESREDLLRAINSFLEDSIVLPPGDWDHRTLLPITHMARRRAQLRQQKKQQMEKEKEAVHGDKGEKHEPPADPLQRTGCLFGGVVNDIRRRYPHYLSDIKDAANKQCIAALFFIFFTCLSPCIAFGGLLSEKTHSLMGVSETMVATSIFGMMFASLCGQPLLILGATGPVLVFEESLYKFCESYELEFLPVRFWVGLWVFAITTLAVALELSYLVRFVTRFTEEIFAILISLIFIYEVIKKLMQIFAKHPLMHDYCDIENSSYILPNGSSFLTDVNQSDAFFHPEYNFDVNGSVSMAASLSHYTEEKLNQPNTALMSLILTLGTFLIAYFLRVFRNSKFLGRSVRRALGDFGVLIALVLMTSLGLIMKETYVQKLDLTDPLTPTSPTRGWFINPMGMDKPIPGWITVAAALPGFLIFILLFMETQITQMILNKKERKLKKGSGYHLDQIILGFLTFVGGLFGLPWMCAATVRTVAHVSALSEYSRTHAPGEKPQLLGVKEQRVTNFMVHFLIGLSVLLRPVLCEIPVPALFGVFLYLGVSAMSGVQMFDRIKLLLMPVKYHPSVSYVRKTRTMRMHMFTLIQLGCLIILLVIKSTPAALVFPFMLILLVPLRMKLVGRIFSNDELEQLDKEEEDFDLDDEDDPDFYQQAHMPI